MQMVLRRVLLVLSILLLVSGVGAAYPAPDSIVGAPQAPRVYVLSGGDAATDTAVVNALRAVGMDVTLGVETPDFSANEADLRDFDTVLVLYNRNVSRVLAPAGVNALIEYVQSGGGLVSSEWLIWQTVIQNYPALGELLPATSCGIQTAGSTTFTQLTPNAVINAGLPAQFTLPLGNFSGSQGCLIARPEAAAFYTNTYLGRDDAVGLAAWNPPGGSGRVASFATLLSATELATTEGKTLLQNTVTWVAGGRDLTPPVIQELSVTGAGTIGSSRDLTISLTAEDRGGSGVGTYYLVEYVYSNNPTDPWRVVQRSGWQPYGNEAQIDLAWQLTTDPGIHYLQAFVADKAGNVVTKPALEFLNLQSGTVPIAQDEVKIYRITPDPGATVTVRMDAASGNPDLYVFGENTAYDDWVDGPSEAFSFTADGGVYQIEVEGYEAGSYQLEVSGGGVRAALDGAGLDARRRRSIITLSTYAPTTEDAGLPLPPAVTGPASIGRVIYLPFLTESFE